jgi:hypothetical protein
MLQKKPLMKKPMVSRPANSSSGGGLNIQQSEGKISIYKTAWCVIGPPGVGKSTLFSGFDSVLYLVTSEKEVGRLKVPYILIDSWEKMLSVTDELIDNRSKYPYKFVVVDFIDAVWTMCAIATCEKLGVAHYTDAQWGKGSDTLDNYFKKWVTKFIASDYGFMCISHVNQKDVMQQGGTITKTICTLPNRARMVLFPLLNVVGTIEYKQVKEKSSVPGKIAFVKKRVIRFEGTEYVEAKDRDNCLPSELILSKDPKLNFQTFKEYYEGKR